LSVIFVPGGYKRRQYPPGTKITLKAFGRDRRLPMTNAWREGKA
jgi:NAD+ synthase (glutamine-hydrolysing)